MPPPSSDEYAKGAVELHEGLLPLAIRSFMGRNGRLACADGVVDGQNFNWFVKRRSHPGFSVQGAPLRKIEP
jgi:hypothetical protein